MHALGFCALEDVTKIIETGLGLRTKNCKTHFKMLLSSRMKPSVDGFKEVKLFKDPFRVTGYELPSSDMLVDRDGAEGQPEMRHRSKRMPSGGQQSSV